MWLFKCYVNTPNIMYNKFVLATCTPHTYSTYPVSLFVDLTTPLWCTSILLIAEELKPVLQIVNLMRLVADNV